MINWEETVKQLVKTLNSNIPANMCEILKHETPGGGKYNTRKLVTSYL